MRGSLLWRLLAAHLLGITVAMLIAGVLIRRVAAGAFMDLMKAFHIETAGAHAAFVAATTRYLLLAGLLAAAVSLGVGYLLFRRIVRPLATMRLLADRIAAGDRTGPVPVRGADEVASLAASFNRMADSLDRVERLRADLVANVAHELRTPLATLRGYLEAMRDGLTPPDPETLASLHDEAMRLVRLVEGLQQLSSLDARLTALAKQPVDVAAVVERLAELSRERFRACGITLRVERDGPATAPADPDLVAQAVTNLLDNALRYTPEGGEVTVAVEAGARRVQVVTENTGEVADADLPYLFERFFRAERSRARDSGGAGIGLALVKAIAQAHGGTVGASAGNGRVVIWFSLAAGAA